MRYGLYAAPAEGTPLLAAARLWLGRDEATGEDIAQPAVAGLSRGAVADATAEPRRYGFHATLKAPFRLYDGQGGAGEAALLDAAAAFAARTPAAVLDSLRVGRIGRFLALVGQDRGGIRALADAVVTAFEPFRAPLTPAERERRLASGLGPAQAALLERWGYPYVFDEFRFHMTLTGPLDVPVIDAMEAAARSLFAPWLGGPLAVDTLAVFAEAAPGEPFRRLASMPLQG